jgi:uncharacterized membrane protein YjgN (DUF898 family)
MAADKEYRMASSPDESPAPAAPQPAAAAGAPALPRHWIDTASAGAPRDRLVTDAQVKDVFVMFLINVALGIVTLGFYRFWGKTRIRKYLWSHVSFRGERFEYSGTGMELFLGFLIALAIFGPPIIGYNLWAYLDPIDPRDPDPVKLALYVAGSIVFILALYLMLHGAVFSAQRYRMTRSIWRGIRGQLDGSAWTYAFLGLGLSLLNLVSLFWTRPWCDTVLLNYRLGRASIGDRKLQATIGVKGLYGPFTVTWVATALAVVGVFAVFIAYVYQEARRLGHPPTEEEAQRIINAVVWMFLLIPIVYLMTVSFYRAALIRAVAAATRWGGVGFAFPVKGWTLLWFNLSNYAMILGTVGLALPYVMVRYVRFVARHLSVDGDIEYAALKQAEGAKPRLGEGLAEYMGVGLF